MSRAFLIFALLFALASQATPITVSKSFTSATTGGGLFVKNHDKFSYVVSGTFVATLGLEFTVDGGLSWERVSTFTAAGSGYVVAETKNGASPTYRFRAYSYTSGTAVTTITEEDAPVPSEEELRNSLGDTVCRITERGMTCDELVATNNTGLIFGAATTQTTSFTAAYGNVYIVDSTAGAITITMPAPVAGASFIVKEKTGQASTNAITFARPGSQKIDNSAANKVWSTDYGSVFMYTNGTDYFTL